MMMRRRRSGMAKKGARRHRPQAPKKPARGRGYVPPPGGPMKDRKKEANKQAARKRWTGDDDE
jgi:hypothetical protein